MTASMTLKSRAEQRPESRSVSAIPVPDTCSDTASCRLSHTDSFHLGLGAMLCCGRRPSGWWTKVTQSKADSLFNASLTLLRLASFNFCYTTAARTSSGLRCIMQSVPLMRRGNSCHNAVYPAARFSTCWYDHKYSHLSCTCCRMC